MTNCNNISKTNIIPGISSITESNIIPEISNVTEPNILTKSNLVPETSNEGENNSPTNHKGDISQDAALGERIFFKSKKPFTQMRNDIIDNHNLSSKAKIIYITILRYITIPNFILYKSFLVSKITEGTKYFDSGWKEIKDKGFLKQYRSPSGRHGSFTYRYELLDEPDTSTPGLINLNRNGVPTQKSGSDSPYTPKGGTCKKSTQGTTSNSPSEHTPPKASMLKSMLYNQTNLNNNTYSFSDSSSDNSTKKVNDDFDDWIEKVKLNIGYESLWEETNSVILELIFKAINSMAKGKTVRVSKQIMQKSKVMDKILTLNSDALGNIVDSLSKVGLDSIQYPNQYILTTLYAYKEPADNSPNSRTSPQAYTNTNTSENELIEAPTSSRGYSSHSSSIDMEELQYIVTYGKLPESSKHPKAHVEEDSSAEETVESTLTVNCTNSQEDNINTVSNSTGTHPDDATSQYTSSCESNTNTTSAPQKPVTSQHTRPQRHLDPSSSIDMEELQYIITYGKLPPWSES